MNIVFTTDSSKIYLAKYGPSKVFGLAVDKRENFSDLEAMEWFDRYWESKLGPAIQQARYCDLDYVREKVPYKSQGFIDESAKHREFTLSGCMFIAQLQSETTCNQLWFIPSSSADPRTLYIKFRSVDIKSEFDSVAAKLGWKPEELGEKLCLDFIESVTKCSFREVKAKEDASDIFADLI